MRRRKRKVLYGLTHEGVDAKIRRMLRLPLGERYDAGLVTGDLAKRLERNQRRLNGPKSPRRIQVLQLPAG